MRQCPNISITSANDSKRELLALSSLLHQRESNSEDNDDCKVASFVAWNWANESEEAFQEIVEDDSAIHKQYSSSPNLREIEEEESQNIIGEDSAKSEHTNASPNLENSKEASKKIAEKDSTAHTQSSNLPNMTKNMNATTNDIVEEQLSSSHTAAASSSNLDMIVHGSLELRVQESSKLDGAIEENQIMNSKSSNASPTSSIIPQENKSSHEAEATMGEGLSSEKHDTNKEKVEASVRENPKLEEVVMSNEVRDSKLKTILAPFASPLQVESAQETMEEASVLKGQRPGEAVLADEVMDSKLSNIPLPFSSASQIESPQVPSISAHGKPQIETSTTPLDIESSHSDLPDISATTESAQDETWTDEENKFGKKSKQYEEHDHMRLFQITEEAADIEVHMPYVHKIIADLQHHDEVAKALANLAASLKIGLNEIATSEENRLCLEKALTILSSYCSEDGPPSNSLQAAIHSMHEEIQRIVSSFNQAHDTIDTFTKLEQKEKLMMEQRSQRKEVAAATLSAIHRTENSMVEAQLKEAELKEHISKLQAELDSKKKKIEECKIKLLSLQEQDRKSASDDIGFIMEFEEVKKERSSMVEAQVKAREQLKNMDAKWSSCLSNFMKTTLLLGIHLKQKL
ncbi:uncharacterized protein LOC129285160 isoform X2 [Prosopis cineraria]|uniref:uncharacterized protein LOC129285160 isoform X2 n=1 Tax=Prosopis cineraria TaxID=364024 RepID=UPI00240EB2D1|nr:uncharacterized protein LOC129285160 isoform X2 [Prosopis cineraria]